MAEKKDPIRSLIDTGRRAGKLTSSEISDAMEENGNVLDVEAMEKLYQVYHGMPKHKQFLHLIEEPAIRKLHEQVESMMLTEMHKEEAREYREELFFTIDERTREAALTDKAAKQRMWAYIKQLTPAAAPL